MRYSDTTAIRLTDPDDGETFDTTIGELADANDEDDEWIAWLAGLLEGADGEAWIGGGAAPDWHVLVLGDGA